jgi:hypothetical protein
VIDRGQMLVAGATAALVEDVRLVHFRGLTAPPPKVIENAWDPRFSAGELRVVLPQFSEERVEALAQQLGATGYEVGRVDLQEFFIALTAEKE